MTIAGKPVIVLKTIVLLKYWIESYLAQHLERTIKVLHFQSRCSVGFHQQQSQHQGVTLGPKR